MTIWHGLLVNFAILAIFVSIWMQAYDVIDRMTAWSRTTSMTVLFTIGTLAVMSVPLQFGPGTLVDLRVTLVLLSAIFGGPLAAVVTVITAALYRLLLGGQGAANGVFNLGFTFLIAMAGYAMLRNARPTARDVLLISAIGAALQPVSWMLYGIRPAMPLVFDTWLPILTLTFVATAVAGLSIVREERRAAATRENELYAAAFKALPNLMNVKDRSGRFIIANPATAAAMGVSSPDAVIGRTVFDFYPEKIAREFKNDDKRVFHEGAVTTERRRVEFADRSIHWLKTTKAPLHDASGTVVGVITHNVDVTESQRLSDANDEIRRQLSEALENMSDGLVVFDTDNRIVICNSQYAALFPRTADLRVAGASLRDILRASIARGEQSIPPGLTLEEWIEQTCANVRQEGTREMHLLDGRWIEGRIRPSENGRSLSLVRDVTAARTAQRALVSINARLEALAATDSLTGLANRRALDDALAREHARALRNGSELSVLVIDVDRFKAYNDTYGHPQGDECLKLVSDILRTAVRRPADVVARFGGEEFVALLPDTDGAGAWTRAEQIRKAVRGLSIPHTGSEKGRVTVTIGAATIASDDRLPGDLVRRADMALYVGKTSGRDQTQRSRTDRELMQIAG